MVWAAMSGNHRTPLVFVDGNLTAQRYVDEILRPHLVPFMQAHPDLRIFQQDNARPHSARVTTAFLQGEAVDVMPWMPYSPDLSPIEHLWDEIGRRLSCRDPHPMTRQELIQALREEWDRIPQQTTQRLVSSMRRRCAACITANGGHTHY